MKKTLFAILFMIVSLFVFANNASAQETLSPNVEVYAGYQGVNNAENFKFSNTVNGANVSGTLYFAGSGEPLPLGVTVEGAGNFKNGDSLLSALGGLTFKARQLKTFQPFVRGLAGAARSSVGKSDTGFAFTAGGGLDVKVRDTVSIRVVQVDYFQTRLFGATQNNVRFGAGIVF
jgi:opacity protein-like surface antigen